MAVICPDCGEEVKFIVSHGKHGVFMVDTEAESLIGETGRVLTGYRVHKCRKSKKEGIEPRDSGEGKQHE